MLANIKKSLLCISAISCMSLYASFIQVNNPIKIGNYKGSNTKVATDLTNTDYNYWLDGKTYVFNISSNNNNKGWVAYDTVTINNGYTLKLITDCTDRYYYVLYCKNTFTNDGNVIIDNYGGLVIDYNNTTIGNSTNNGTIDVNNGYLGLRYNATVNNGYLGLYYMATLTNTGTITLTGSSYIYIFTGTLTNTGTIDISNITDLSKWYNEGTFTLEGGSTFILPKSILEDSKKIGSTYTFNPITLNGTKDKPVNIVIPKGCKYITDIDNDNKGVLFNALEDATGLTFDGDKNNVKFSWQKIK